jgi:hypothetical protein
MTTPYVHGYRAREGERPLRTSSPAARFVAIDVAAGSVACFYPDSPAARAAIQCQIDLQRAAGGDALIGRQLFPLLAGAGFDDVKVSPRLIYVDGSRPALADACTIKTFTAMIEGTRDVAVAAGLATAEAFDDGVRDLYRAAWPDGVFCYTFFKATAVAAQAREPRA